MKPQTMKGIEKLPVLQRFDRLVRIYYRGFDKSDEHKILVHDQDSPHCYAHRCPVSSNNTQEEANGCLCSKMRAGAVCKVCLYELVTAFLKD